MSHLNRLHADGLMLHLNRLHADDSNVTSNRNLVRKGINCVICCQKSHLWLNICMLSNSYLFFILFFVSKWTLSECQIVWTQIRPDCLGLILVQTINIYIFKESHKWIFKILQPSIASWMTLIWLAAPKVTCPCKTLRTSNSFAKSDTGVVINSEPHLSRTCKQAYCLLNWMFVFTMAVPPFSFTLLQNR